MDYVPITKRVRGCNRESDIHFGGRRQLTAFRLVNTLGLLRISMSGCHTYRVLPFPVSSVQAGAEYDSSILILFLRVTKKIFKKVEKGSTPLLLTQSLCTPRDTMAAIAALSSYFCKSFFFRSRPRLQYIKNF